jgi:hypothetical protein
MEAISCCKKSYRFCEQRAFTSEQKIILQKSPVNLQKEKGGGERREGRREGGREGGREEELGERVRYPVNARDSDLPPVTESRSLHYSGRLVPDSQAGHWSLALCAQH